MADKTFNYSTFAGTYGPTADRHNGAVVYKKMVTDEDQHGPRWLYKEMGSSINLENAKLSIADVKFTTVCSF